MSDRIEHTLFAPRIMVGVDENGNPSLINSLHNALNVHEAHVHHLPVNEFFHAHTGVATTIAVASAVNDTSIEVVSAIGFVIGDFLQIENGVIETTFPVITNIVGNVFTLDRPLNHAYSIGDSVEVILIDMSVVGSLAAPVSYKLSPDPNQVWHVMSFIISATFTTAADDSLFGNLTALTNGVVLRGYDGTTGTYRTFTNWKSNSDIKLDMYDVPYTDKAGAGLFGMNGNGAIYIRTGAVPELNGSAGDYLEILIQDNVSGLSSLKLKGQGHLENI